MSDDESPEENESLDALDEILEEDAKREDLNLLRLVDSELGFKAKRSCNYCYGRGWVMIMRPWHTYFQYVKCSCVKD